MSKLRKYIRDVKDTTKEEGGGCDPAIKLFGQTIVPDSGANKTVSWDTSSQEGGDAGDGIVVQAGGDGVAEERLSSSDSTSGPEDEKPYKSGMPTEAVRGVEASDPGIICEESEGGPSEERERVDEGGQGTGSEDKTLRKPEKVVACPRCDSLDTKFCYYNNYNVNQPRHFCKNCQRYWTAGGTLRNVPVGAGRRKNKYGGGLQPRHGGPAEGGVITTVRSDVADAAQQLLPGSLPAPKVSHLKIPQASRIRSQCSPLDSSPGGSSITSFCQDSGLADNAPSVFSLHRLTAMPAQSYSNNFVGSDSGGTQQQKVPKDTLQSGVGSSSEVANEMQARETMDDCGNCWTPLSNPKEPSLVGGPMSHLQLQPDCAGLYRPMPAADTGSWTSGGAPFSFFNGAWPYGHGVGWAGAATVPPGAGFCTPPLATTIGSGSIPANGVQAWSTPSGGVWTGVHWGPPMPGMPGTSWVPQAWGGGWTMPWAPAAAAALAAQSSSSANGPILPAKRDRPAEEGALWAPKTLRIEDPGEGAAPSGVWATPGSKNWPDSVNSGSMFKAFQPKTEIRSSDVQEENISRHENPAAMTRSMRFQERN